MGSQKLSLTFIIAIGTLICSAHSIDYCAIKCDSSEQHIGCGNNGTLDANCPKNAKVVDLRADQFAILDKHNSLRNAVAGGKVVTHLKPAVNMTTMSWDPELARLATFNVLRCKLQHDNCHSTVQFKSPGQNLAMDTWIDSKQTVRKIILKQIQGWYDENKLASNEDIQSLGTNWLNIGHFLPIVNEKNTHVGCGCVKYEQNGVNYLFTACNYAFNNFINESTYKAGPKAATNCKFGVNPNYTNLCAVEEYSNVNSI